MKNLANKLRAVKQVTSLKTFTVKEAMDILTLFAKTGTTNGFLDFDKNSDSETKKAMALTEQLETKGFNVYADFENSHLSVEWH